MELPGFFFGYSGAFGELDCVLVICSIAASFGICLGAVNGSGRMVRWGVDRGELQGTMSDVDDVVPGTAWNKQAVPLAELDLRVQTVLIAAHSNQSNTGLHTNKLIRVFMNLQTDISAGRNAHEGHLQVCPSPESCAEILVVFGGTHDVRREWPWTMVAELVFLAMICIHTILPSLADTGYENISGEVKTLEIHRN